MTLFTRKNAWELGDVVPDKPLQSGQWWVPGNVFIEGEDIAWSAISNKTASTKAGMLDQFTRLHGAPPKDILAFAAKWGIMGFCKHGLPLFHADNWDVLNLRAESQSRECALLSTPATARGGGKPRRFFAEPINYWRRSSSAATAILNIGARLNQEQLGDLGDWRIASMYMRGVDWSDDHYRKLGILSGLGAQRSQLGTIVTDWIRVGGFAPTLQWSDDRGRWEMRLIAEGLSLFGAIGLALMMAVSQKGGLAFCSNCPNTYMPTRRPNPNRRNYCPECREKGIPWRDAARAARAKRKVIDIGKPSRKRG
jgi:hypothetical protein